MIIKKNVTTQRFNIFTCLNNLLIIISGVPAYGCLVRRHSWRWCQIVHVWVIAAIVLMMMCRRVVVMCWMMMCLVMVMMGRVAISSGAAVCRVASTGTDWRWPVVVVVQVHQTRRWFRDSRTPYWSRSVAATT